MMRRKLFLQMETHAEVAATVCDAFTDVVPRVN